MSFLHRLALLPLAALLTLGGTPARATAAAGAAAAAPSPCSSHLRQQRARADLDATYNPCRLDDGAVGSGKRTNDGDSAQQLWNGREEEAPRHRFLDLGEQHALGLALGGAAQAGDGGLHRAALPGWRLGMEEEEWRAASQGRTLPEVRWWGMPRRAGCAAAAWPVPNALAWAAARSPRARAAWRSARRCRNRLPGSVCW
ncbi:hypothetical protein MJ904_14440 [Massilia sp. MB5]|uniref:hypothetical protein n=1 Tax=Massilia sp. MB5 TaxID=2919578 RepID=UPI001F0CF7D3|nr:hypothetical protein [Massilia sp. MB5]UMR28372.1 hypothetical protein MJ904_14440 [Massilia sp. MB5]